MRSIKLGRTDLEVSRICFGTWQYGGEWGDFDRGDAFSAIRRARELGINFFDTAQGYGFGQAEEILSEGLGDELQDEREKLVIATKGGLRPEEDGVVRDSEASWIRAGVESSLEHLETDYIDLYQVHWPDPEVSFEETAGVLRELRDEGLIRHVGVSNFDAEQLEQFEEQLPVETLQPPYHLFRRDIEQDILPWCARTDTGVLVYGPLAHGLLSGKFDTSTELPENDWRAGTPLFSGAAYEQNLEVVERLGSIAQEREITVAQLAVAWTLAQPGVHSAIVGARSPDHIEGTAAAAEIDLDRAVLDRIEDVMKGAAAVGGPSPEGV